MQETTQINLNLPNLRDITLKIPQINHFQLKEKRTILIVA